MTGIMNRIFDDYFPVSRVILNRFSWLLFVALFDVCETHRNIYEFILTIESKKKNYFSQNITILKSYSTENITVDSYYIILLMQKELNRLVH